MKHTLLAFALVLAGAPAVVAQTCGTTFTDTFTGGTNVGGWFWGGPNDQIATSGGFPTNHRVTAGIDTIAPQLRSSGASTFTGDYRATSVTAISLDLQAFHIDFPTSCQRPLSLLLEDDMGTPDPSDDTYVYFLTSNTPCVDGLWHSYAFDIPSQSTTLPAGWAVDPNSPFSADVTWNTVIQDVDRVRFFFGDPTFFFIFQMWTVGADNVRIARDQGAVTYCLSKENSLGCQPSIDASGTVSATLVQPFPITAVDEINNKSGILFYGFAPLNSPFQGGTLCVQPPIERTPPQSSGGNPPPNDCSGFYAFDFNAWILNGNDPALVPGVTVFAQYWARDPQSPSTTNTSNATRFDVCQ